MPLEYGGVTALLNRRAATCRGTPGVDCQFFKLTSPKSAIRNLKFLCVASAG
jgi:hypothetical protein